MAAEKTAPGIYVLRDECRVRPLTEAQRGVLLAKLHELFHPHPDYNPQELADDFHEIADAIDAAGSAS